MCGENNKKVEGDQIQRASDFYAGPPGNVQSTRSPERQAQPTPGDTICDQSIHACTMKPDAFYHSMLCIFATWARFFKQCPLASGNYLCEFQDLESETMVNLPIPRFTL